MNSTESSLARLLRAAQAAPPQPLPSEAPFAFEAQVLASWRRNEPQEVSFLPVLRGAFVCACAIILVSVAFTLQTSPDNAANELLMVDSVMQMTLMQ